jgi:Ca-activated chloride channel family protein
MFYFRDPEYFVLFALIPLAIVWYFFWHKKRQLEIKLTYDPGISSGNVVFTTILGALPYLFIITSLSLVIVSLARPQESNTFKEQFAEGIDIILTIDISKSMETADFQPNRLEVAKRVVSNFIGGRVDDRIGVVVFAEDAFSYCPLTLDYSLIKELVEGINFKIMPNQGTAIGSAIAVSVNRLVESNAKSKVMILLTDGASNKGQIDPITASLLAADENIKIYCIGIGKKEFTINHPVFGPRKQVSDLDEETLKKIADNTGGLFFRSTDPKNLEVIFSKISSMERTEVKEESYTEVTDLYPGYLKAGIISLLIAFLFMAINFYNPLEG